MIFCANTQDNEFKYTFNNELLNPDNLPINDHQGEFFNILFNNAQKNNEDQNNEDQDE